MKHTKEPWRIQRHRNQYNTIVSETGFMGGDIATVKENGQEGTANGKRIIDCVNACEGINPKAVPDLLEALKVLVMCHAKGGFIQPDTDVLEQAKVAIAKADLSIVDES